MLDTNSIFSNLVVINSPQQILSVLGSHKVEIQNNTLVVEHVFLARVCSYMYSYVDRKEKRIVQRILPVKL